MVLGVVLVIIEVVAKPLLLLRLKNTWQFSSCGKSYPSYFWGSTLIKCRDYKGGGGETGGVSGVGGGGGGYFILSFLL